MENFELYRRSHDFLKEVQVGMKQLPAEEPFKKDQSKFHFIEAELPEMSSLILQSMSQLRFMGHKGGLPYYRDIFIDTFR